MKFVTMKNPDRIKVLGIAVCAVLAALQPAGAQVTPAKKRPEREGTFTYKDPRLPVRFPARGWQTFISSERSSTFDFGPKTDPKFKKEYQYRMQVKCNTEMPEAVSDRRFVVHFQKVEDEPLARRVGALMARLYWLGTDYLGVGSTGSQYINVWLSHEGEPGAEEFQKNLYLYAIDQPRAPAEWVRELAHEYSHIYLPQMGEYSKPEQWASGYLGERLFLKWLLHDNAMSDVWDEPIDGAAYVANQVAPLRDKFLNEGPNSPLTQKMDAEGMDFLIGQIMALEAAHGPVLIKHLMNRFATKRPQNLPLYLTAAMNDLQPTVLPLHPQAFIPQRTEMDPAGAAPGAVKFKKVAYWLYLPGGDWQIALTGNTPATTVATLESVALAKGVGGGAAGQVWETSVTSANGVWRRLEIAAPAGQTAEIRTITVAKRGGGARPGFGQPGVTQPSRPGTGPRPGQPRPPFDRRPGQPGQPGQPPQPGSPFDNQPGTPK